MAKLNLARYLCVDDESAVQLEPLLDRLRAQGISIELGYPASFDEEVDAICNSDVAGLLLDLRLDNVPSDQGRRVKYRALALAQELRTRMTEGLMRSLPIVLWSVEHKFELSYEGDSSGHDLFDIVISKTAVRKDAARIASRMRSLAGDYPNIGRLRKTRGFRGILGLNKKKAALLDPRVGEEVGDRAPDHECARYVLRELLEIPGPLVSEELLAARLGSKVGTGQWRDLIALFEPARYSGVFAAAWPRWWWPHVEAEWRRLSEGRPLRSLDATQRVAVLRSATGFRRLRVADSTSGSSGSKFWHLCAATGQPLDPVDAVLTLHGPLKPWQEPVYVSLTAALSKAAAVHGLRMDPLEIDRLNFEAEARANESTTSRK